MKKEQADEILERAWAGLTGYCDHYSLEEPSDTLRARIVRVTRAFCNEGWGPEHDCGFIALLDDGKYLVVDEGEDTTGHGCQCSATAAIYDTEEEAIRLGWGYNGKDSAEDVVEGQS